MSQEYSLRGYFQGSVPRTTSLPGPTLVPVERLVVIRSGFLHEYILFVNRFFVHSLVETTTEVASSPSSPLFSTRGTVNCK